MDGQSTSGRQEICLYIQWISFRYYAVDSESEFRGLRHCRVWVLSGSFSKLRESSEIKWIQCPNAGYDRVHEWGQTMSFVLHFRTFSPHQPHFHIRGICGMCKSVQSLRPLIPRRDVKQTQWVECNIAFCENMHTNATLHR